MVVQQGHSAFHTSPLMQVYELYTKNGVHKLINERHLKSKFLPTSRATKSKFSSTWPMALWISNSRSTSSFMPGGTTTVGGFKLYKPRVATYIGSPPWISGYVKTCCNLCFQVLCYAKCKLYMQLWKLLEPLTRKTGCCILRFLGLGSNDDFRSKCLKSWYDFLQVQQIRSVASLQNGMIVNAMTLSSYNKAQI